MKILITSGPMQEPIDSARYIGNRSTGTTGANLASHLQKSGHEVVFIYGEGFKDSHRVFTNGKF